MYILQLHKKVYSKVDNTIKYVFEYKKDFLIEFSYINKNDGKDIICVPCQTMCSMNCKFCHTNDYIGKIKEENLSACDIVEGIDYITNDLNLGNGKQLLISFMGCGEPMKTHSNIMIAIQILSTDYSNIRFAVATSIPRTKSSDFVDFAKNVEVLGANVKMHLSLHHVDSEKRYEMMPNSASIKESLLLLELYKEITVCACEIHYTLIDGVNDRPEDFAELIKLFEGKDIPIKFLHYNDKDGVDYSKSDTSKLAYAFHLLDHYNIAHEYYVPPGLDIGASCGQFLMEVVD